MRTKKFTLVFIVFFTVIFFFSCKTQEIILHGEIIGLVTDTMTSQPLQAVLVKLNPINDTTITGIDGKYFFKSLIPMDYKIEVSKPDYAREIKDTTVTSANATEINFALSKIAYPAFSDRYMDFGFDSTHKSFVISNTGTEKLTYSIHASKDWITVNPNIGEIASEPQTINITINRAGLSEKKHIESLQVVTNIGLDYVANTINIFVNGVMDQDKNYYGIVTIGTQTWLAENLNVGTFVNNTSGQKDNNSIEKYCYYNDKGNCDIYGGLYHWDEMMKYNPQDSGTMGTTQGICPVGWHIPTLKEWEVLISYAGGSSFGGGKLKDTGTLWMQPNIGATNQTGFSALPGGLGGSLIDQDPVWSYIGEGSFFWSSTFFKSEDPNLFTMIIIGYDNAGVITGYGAIDNGLQVRCIKDQGKR
jgi:uncharacterized protein (TIGR02145 family)